MRIRATRKFASVGLSGGRRGGNCGRNQKRQPGIPAGGLVAGFEFAVGFQVHIALQPRDREQVANLRTDPNDARLKRPELPA